MKELFKGDDSKKFISLFVSFIVFYFAIIKPQLVGFIPGHHGFVSSEQLSMIVKSTIENGFVGYRFLENGHPQYFSKMSFLFSASFNALISTSENISNALDLSRYIMDVTLFLVLALTYNFLCLVTNDWRTSLLGVIFGGCGSLLVYYNDLISPDIFLALSFLISIHALYYIKINRYKVGILLVFISINFGFLLINFLPYLLWGGVLFLKLIFNKIKIRFFLKNISIVLFAGVCTTSLFFYSIHQEAKIRNISFEQTDIYKSFSKRSGGYGSEYYNEYLKGKIEFGNYVPNYINDFIEFVLSPNTKNILKVENTTTTTIIFLCLALCIIRERNKSIIRERNEIITIKNIELLLILSVSSLYTLFILKGYVIIHDFGKIPVVIFSIIVWGGVFSKIHKKYFPALFFIGLFIFYNAYIFSHTEKMIKLNKQNIEITDLDNIKKYFKNGKYKLYVDKGYFTIYGGAPFSLGFFLKNQNIVSIKDHADYIISKSKRNNTLTPNNQTLFLYKKDLFKLDKDLYMEFIESQEKLKKNQGFNPLQIGKMLFLYKKDCKEKDIKDTFLFHVIPLKISDLPKEMQKYEIENLDFNISDHIFSDNICFIEKNLPNYEIQSIDIGQYNDTGRIWSKKIKVNK